MIAVGADTASRKLYEAAFSSVTDHCFRCMFLFRAANRKQAVSSDTPFGGEAEYSPTASSRSSCTIVFIFHSLCHCKYSGQILGQLLTQWIFLLTLSSCTCPLFSYICYILCELTQASWYFCLFFCIFRIGYSDYIFFITITLVEYNFGCLFRIYCTHRRL